MQGLILHVFADPAHDRMVDRPDQVPCFYLDDGTAVFEVWFWHSTLQRWFCMSTVFDPTLIAQGVVFFWPGDTQGLTNVMLGLEGQAGFPPRIVGG